MDNRQLPDANDYRDEDTSVTVPDQNEGRSMEDDVDGLTEQEAEEAYKQSARRHIEDADSLNKDTSQKVTAKKTHLPQIDSIEDDRNKTPISEAIGGVQTRSRH